MQTPGREYQDLFDQSPLAMWVFDAETLAVLAVNESAVRQYGYTRAEFLANTIEDLRFPEDCPALHVALDRFRKEDQQLARKPCRWRHRKKDGVPVYVELLWQQTRFAERPAILTTVVDFTEHLEDAPAPEIHTRYPAPTIRDMFWDWDLQSAKAPADAKRSFMNYTGEGTEPRLDWWYQRIHPEDRDRVARGLRNLFSSGKELWEDEYRYLRADGAYALVVDRGYLIRNEHDEPVRMVGTLVDVTLRRQAEQQARLYGDIINNMQIGLYVHRMENLEDDASFRILLANPASEKITGVRPSDLVGKTLDHGFPALRKNGIIEVFADVVRTGKAVLFEDLVYQDHRVAQAHFSARFFPLPNQCLGVAFENITEKLHTEEQFRRVENRFQILAAVLPVGIFQNDVNGNVIYVNQKCCELCGVEASELLGRRWTRILHPEDRRRISGRWQTCVRRRIPFQAEYRLLQPGGTTVWALGQAVPEYGRDGEFAGYIGSITDITERKRLENEITEISGQEQQRIGQALHDRLGQHLTGIAFLAKALAGKLQTKATGEAEQAEEIARLINQAILRTRDLARMLHPVELEENGLIAAFQDLVSNARRIFNIGCHFQCDPDVVGIENAVTVHLYHIAQEAITNAVKHGRATNVTIELGRGNGHAFLRIEDNGDGLHDEPPGTTGIGLRIMRHRAALIEGDLQIGPAQRGGTVITCTFAIKHPQPIGDRT